MKKIIFFFILAITILSCEEIPPVINSQMGGVNPVDTSSVDGQQRQVLVEEFTGVRCVNCPAGSEALENLKNIYGQRLVVVSIHAGGFAPPYPESQYDFRTAEGNSIQSYLGEPFGYPTAVVDRQLYDGEFDLQLAQSQWPGFIAEELVAEPLVKIGMEQDYLSSSRELRVDVTVFLQETILEDDVRLSLMIVENDIEDYQLTPGGKQNDYKHKHVLRGMMTAYDGNPLAEDLIQGAQIEKSFVYTLPEAWKAEQCSVVAFVHLNGDQKDVLQAHEVGLVE